MYRFPETDRMPDNPALPVPDYAELNRKFRAALMDPSNKILRHSLNGHPIFGAYLNLDSNELVTWGILAVGEWLAGRDARWIAVTYPDFFVPEIGIYMNTPGNTASEFWYLFYIKHPRRCGYVYAVPKRLRSERTVRQLSRHHETNGGNHPLRFQPSGVSV